MSIVEQYWGGVLQRLRAEVDVFARLVQHMGERGRMNELALARLLESFVPDRIGVGTGVLFDAADSQSAQTDVVLFDRANQPAIMAQTTQVLFPVEVVTACVEVKTTLTSGDVEDCIKKRKRLYELAPAKASASRHPPFVVLAYDASFASAQAVIDSFARDIDHLPDLLCVLDVGLIGGRHPPIAEASKPWRSGLALSCSPEGDGYLEVDPMMERVEVDGRMVAVVDHNGGHFAADPGRALLLFADALAQMSADHIDAPSPILSAYLSDRMRDLAILGSPLAKAN